MIAIQMVGLIIITTIIYSYVKWAQIEIQTEIVQIIRSGV